MPRLSTLAALVCAFAVSVPLASASGSIRSSNAHAHLAHRALDLEARDLNGSDAFTSTLEKRAPRCKTADECPDVQNGVGICVKKRCAVQCKVNRALNAAGTKCLPIVPVVAPIANNGKHCTSDARCQANLPDHASGSCVNNECEVTCESGYQSTRGSCIESLPLDSTSCRKDGDCGVGVSNAYGVCYQRACTLYCKTGYQLLNGACLAAPAKAPAGAPGCKADTDCPAKRNGYGVCSSGKCAFTCFATFAIVNNNCVATTEGCTSDASCPNGPTNSNLVGVCDSGTGHCTTQCASGFAPKNGKCVASTAECDAGACGQVVGGYSICVAGACSAQCYGGQGYKLFCSASSCQCINASSDPDNCGSAGTKCAATYNGLGTRTCKNGECGIDCGSLSAVKSQSGVSYCKPAQRR